MDRPVDLLVLDSDERRSTQTVAELEEMHDWSVRAEPTIAAGLDGFDPDAVDCIVSANTLDDGTCLDALSEFRAANGTVPFVVYADTVPAEMVRELFGFERTDYAPTVEGAESALSDRVRQLVAASRESTAGAQNPNGPTDTQELSRERERFSDLFSNFPEPTIAYGFQGSVTVFKAVNDAFESVFGYDETEILDKSVNDLIVPENHQPESENIDDQVDSGEMVDRIVRRLAADGTRIFNLRSIPVSAPGEIDGFAVYSDITERKRRERELERYETIVKTIPMGVVTVNDDWNIGKINTQGAEMLGYEVADLLGEPFVKLRKDGVISDEEQGIAEQVVESLSEDPNSVKSVTEVTITPEPDVTRELEVHTSLLPAESDTSGVVLVFHDITERKANERQLRRQNERLEEFASIVSHDLRNPLNVAMGHIEILELESDSESVDRVTEALARMQTLIQETLELAKQGEMVTETRPIQLSSLVEDCWGMIDQADATLECDGDIQFRADPSRVKQLFENLFRNSIEHGGDDVRIRVAVEDETLVVADDGPGISPDKREDIFEAGHTSSEDGTGFGLAIVAEIVDAHDWDIHVTESVDGGARFEITGVELVPES
jgi:PAS domain S-box-containing protein